MTIPKVVLTEWQPIDIKRRQSKNFSTVNWKRLSCTVKDCWMTMMMMIVMIIMCFIGTAAGCRGGTLIRTGVAPEEKIQILETHNRLRSSVAQGRVPNQPGAENMQEMVWDNELAQKAQQWANQCTFQHDPSRYLDRFTMGQNLAIIWSTIPLADDDGDFPSRIQNWFNEVQKYAWGAQWSPATGHYSQLVWGDTNLIGCGFSYYKDSRRYNKLWVCNYGPGGNVVGSAPYEVGRPACRNYGMLPSKRYTGLCLSYSGTSAEYNPKNNFITQNTYTLKTERFNPPTYQVQDKIKNVFNQVFPSSQTTNFKADYALKSVFNNVRTVLKNSADAVVSHIQPETTFQTITYNYQPDQQTLQQPYEQQSFQQETVNYQQPSVYVAPAQPAYQQTVEPTYEQTYNQPAQQSYEQPQSFQQNNDQTYQQPAQQSYQQPVQQTYQQQSYQQPVQQTYQQPTQQTYQQPVQQTYQQPVQPAYQQPVQQTYQTAAPKPYQPPTKQSYQQPSQQKSNLKTYQQPVQPVHPRQRTLDEIRKAAFLTYDWSQLFNTNFRFRSR